MRDGHVRVLPIHVANKIAAGEVVERPAAVVKELIENALDAGATSIRVTVTQGGRKLIAVQDDGCGMSKEDALLSLERQATSKIADVEDIECIDTLGFRGEAVPSIASVSRFTLTTRRRENDEGTRLTVNAGILAEVASAGCPPGTLIEVRDLFCNVPARRKFLRSYATEEGHVRTVFTVHALAHPGVAFSLVSDGHELSRLAPAADVRDRVRDLFGSEFLESLVALPTPSGGEVRVSGFVERPNLNTPTRRDQYVFVNGRPASAASIAYALREAYPHRPGDVRPAVILFLELPPGQVDVNVHPTKREVRFRDNTAVRQALETAIQAALGLQTERVEVSPPKTVEPVPAQPAPAVKPAVAPPQAPARSFSRPFEERPQPPPPVPVRPDPAPAQLRPAPVEVELPLAAESNTAKPWAWFRFLAVTGSGYLLIETDSGVVTVNPYAARERIAYESLLASQAGSVTSQALLIPETVRLSPPDFARVSAALPDIRKMGFGLEPFGTDTFKVDEVPQLIGSLSVSALLSTIAHDLSEGSGKRSGEKWREELVAKSIARSFAGAAFSYDAKTATTLVEQLASCRMPYVCPRGKPIMIFTSTRELNRKFARD